MIVACAWCEAEGRFSVMAEREPLDDRRVTHSVCVEHHTEVLKQLARMARTPDSIRSLAVPSRK